MELAESAGITARSREQLAIFLADRGVGIVETAIGATCNQSAEQTTLAVANAIATGLLPITRLFHHTAAHHFDERPNLICGPRGDMADEEPWGRDYAAAHFAKRMALWVTGPSAISAIRGPDDPS